MSSPSHRSLCLPNSFFLGLSSGALPRSRNSPFALVILLAGWTSSRRFIWVGFLATLAAVGCTRLPSVEFSLPFGHSDWIELRDAGVIDGVAPALVATVVSRKKDLLWVRFVINQIEGADTCEGQFKLYPQTSHPYRCPLTSVDEGARYRAEITVYKDAGDTQVAERIHRTVELQRSQSGGFELIGTRGRNPVGD